LNTNKHDENNNPQGSHAVNQFLPERSMIGFDRNATKDYVSSVR
jgi:hypothetical protein